MVNYSRLTVNYSQLQTILQLTVNNSQLMVNYSQLQPPWLYISLLVDTHLDEDEARDDGVAVQDVVGRHVFSTPSGFSL